MARIAGVDLPRTKRVEIGLTYIYGIGRVRSNSILKEAGVSPDIRVKDLSEDDVRKISRVIEEQGGVEGDLRKEISMNIKRLMEIGCYRGCGIAAGCRCTASGRAPTRAPARARARARSRRRRRSSGKLTCNVVSGFSRTAKGLWPRPKRRPKAPHPRKKKAPRKAQEDLQEARREAHRPSRAGAHPGVVQQHRR